MSDMDPDQPSELAIGDIAPDFRLPASPNREIALIDYRDKSNVILFFVRAYQVNAVPRGLAPGAWSIESVR
jgi:hypothetical protein